VQANGENFMIAIPANLGIPVTEGTIIQIIPTFSNFATTSKKMTKIVPASEPESDPDPEVGPGPSRGKIKYWNAKERKRAQNREAAQRYRQKKKNEKETRMTDMERLEHRNRQLKLKVSDLDREVGYFKSLIGEIQAAAANWLELIKILDREVGYFKSLIGEIQAAAAANWLELIGICCFLLSWKIEKKFLLLTLKFF